MGPNDQNESVNLYFVENPDYGSNKYIRMDQIPEIEDLFDSGSVETDKNNLYLFEKGASMKMYLKKSEDRIKWRKKSFKKWMMSKGYSRDESESVLELVKEMKGKVTYISIYYYIMLGGKLK